MQHRHFIMHKPFGFISQFVNKNKRKKGLLGALYDFPEGVMAIGRLDAKSEGLLLLTTDGKVSQEIRGKHVEKEYYVQVDGIITAEAIERLETGVNINVEGEHYFTLPAKAKILTAIPDFPERSVPVRDDRHGPTSWVSITITEGKFKQVRKMTAAVGYPTLRLIRTRIGKIYLGELRVGEVMEVDRLEY